MNSDFRIVGTVSNADTLKALLVNPENLSSCDVVELRFDQYMDKDECLELCKKIRKHKQVLLTIRTSCEGGSWVIDDHDRYKLFQFFAPHVDLIDLELKSDLFANYKRSNFPKHLEVVSSYHDYENTPSKEEIELLIKKGKDWGAEIVKLALFTHNEKDVSLLENFLNTKDICLIGMGEAGVVTRLDFPKKGSVLTYGYLDDSAAPGQVSARELREYLS